MRSGRGVSPLLLGLGSFPDQPGGVNRYVHDLHGALMKRSFEVRTVTLGPSTEPRPLHHRSAADEVPPRPSAGHPLPRSLGSRASRRPEIPRRTCQAVRRARRLCALEGVDRSLGRVPTHSARELRCGTLACPRRSTRCGPKGLQARQLRRSPPCARASAHLVGRLHGASARPAHGHRRPARRLAELRLRA